MTVLAKEGVGYPRTSPLSNGFGPIFFKSKQHSSLVAQLSFEKYLEKKATAHWISLVNRFKKKPLNVKYYSMFLQRASVY